MIYRQMRPRPAARRIGLIISVALVLAGLAADGTDLIDPLHPVLAVALLAVGLLVAAGPGAMTTGVVVPAVPADRAAALVVSLCVVFTVAYAIRERRAANAAQASEAVLAERARIAREIHDILAHSLSAQIVHLEGARLLLRSRCAFLAFRQFDGLARRVGRRFVQCGGAAAPAGREISPAFPILLATRAAA
ncbi:hypothetical protein GCM10010116_13640 [Microbispora rosea subsp. aerata]|nr:hypothetical protein GCM10010116_13640 [Microbispora rosea subsp. aerata]GIH55029.1 hypothetical protein Mro02_19430 [Microbispora rosea subsp. aerata]GLJ82478.1 hypothetical protein GCM10017588_12030 [Microbispora rosea subsp. aerata]